MIRDQNREFYSSVSLRIGNKRPQLGKEIERTGQLVWNSCDNGRRQSHPEERA